MWVHLIKIHLIWLGRERVSKVKMPRTTCLLRYSEVGGITVVVRLYIKIALRKIGSEVEGSDRNLMAWTSKFSSVQSLSHIQLLQPHGLQHTRLPSPSPTPGACSNSCPLSRWCHPTISSSVIPFFSCLQSFLASRSFQWVSSSHQVAKVLELQLQHQSFQWIFRSDFL